MVSWLIIVHTNSHNKNLCVLSQGMSGEGESDELTGDSSSTGDGDSGDGDNGDVGDGDDGDDDKVGKHNYTHTCF